MVQAGVPVSHELISFYKSRLDSFEKEREAFSKSLQQCTVERGHVYALEQFVSKRTTEVQQLQKALSDSQLKLLEARETVLQLQAERDDLLLEGKEDKARIQSLLAFTQPVLHEVQYASGKEPVGAATYPLFNKRYSGGPTGRSSKEGVDPAATLRTIFLPNEEAQLLVGKLALLQAQLAEQHEFSQERFAALLDDRQRREDAFDAHKAESATKIQDLQAKLEQKEALLDKTTRELLLCRHQQAAAERQFQEQQATQAGSSRQAQHHRACLGQQLDLALQLLPRRCADAVRAMGAALAQAQAQAGSSDPSVQGDRGDDPGASCREAAIAAAGEHACSTEGRYRAQVAALEGEVKQARSAHQATARQQQERIRHLEHQLHVTKARRRDLEYRRALDIEGFASEMLLARSQLVSIERRVRAVAAGAEHTAGTDPLTLVEQLAEVRDQLDMVAAKILEQNKEKGH